MMLTPAEMFEIAIPILDSDFMAMQVGVSNRANRIAAYFNAGSDDKCTDEAKRNFVLKLLSLVKDTSASTLSTFTTINEARVYGSQTQKALANKYLDESYPYLKHQGGVGNVSATDAEARKASSDKCLDELKKLLKKERPKKK